MNPAMSPGQRGLIVGKTGSGKTVASLWLLSETDSPVVIFDTKGDDIFVRKLIPNVVVDSRSALAQALLEGHPFIIVRPPFDQLGEPEKLDEWLIDMMRYRDLVIYIDEGYMFHNAGRAYPGLIGLLTRGRSRGLGLLIASQRPAWLSRFALSESEKFFIFQLLDKRDWKTVSEVVPIDPTRPPDLTRYRFLWYTVGESRAIFMPAFRGYPKLEIEQPEQTFSRWI